jgi:hypothetical protein
VADHHLGRIVLDIVADSSGYESELRAAESAAERFAARARQAFTDIGVIATGALGAVSMALGYSLTRAIDYEDQFAAVRKTWSGSEEDLKVLWDGIKKLASSQEHYTSALENSHEALAEMAGLGAKMGMTDPLFLLEFTETIGLLSMATDILGETGSANLAKFLNVMSTGRDDIGAVGAVITDLGNKFTVFESEILDIATKFSGAAKAAGLTEDEVLALSAATRAVGGQPRASATALMRTFQALDAAVRSASGATRELTEEDKKLIATQGKLGNKIKVLNAQIAANESELKLKQDLIYERLKTGTYVLDSPQHRAALNSLQSLNATLLSQYTRLEDLKFQYRETSSSIGGVAEDLVVLAKVTGMTADEFVKLFTESPAKAFEAFIKGLGGMIDAGQNAQQVLRDMGLGSAQTLQILMSLAQAEKEGELLLSAALSEANTAMKERTALLEEAERRFDTAKAQLIGFKNYLTNIAISVGELFLPAFRELLQETREWVESIAPKIIGYAERIAEWFNNLTPPVRKVVAAMMGFSGAISTIMVATTVMHPFLYRLRRLLRHLLPVIGQIVVIAGLLALAWQTNFMNIRDHLIPIIERLKGMLPGISEDMAKFWQDMVNAFSGGDWAGVVHAIGEMAGRLTNALLTAITGRSGAGVGRAVTAIFDSLVEAIRQADPEPIREALLGFYVSATDFVFPGADIDTTEKANEAWRKWAEQWLLYITGTWLPYAVGVVKAALVQVYIRASRLLLDDLAIRDVTSANKAWETWADGWLTYIRDTWLPWATDLIKRVLVGAIIGGARLIFDDPSISSGEDIGKHIKAAWDRALDWWGNVGKPTAIDWATRFAGWWAGFYEWLLTDYRQSIIDWFEEHKNEMAQAIVDGLAVVLIVAGALLGTSLAILEPIAAGLLVLLGEIFKRLTLELDKFRGKIIGAQRELGKQWDPWKDIGVKQGWVDPIKSMPPEADWTAVAAIAQPILNLLSSVNDFMTDHGGPFIEALSFTIFDLIKLGVMAGLKKFREWAQGDGGEVFSQEYFEALPDLMRPLAEAMYDPTTILKEVFRKPIHADQPSIVDIIIGWFTPIHVRITKELIYEKLFEPHKEELAGALEWAIEKFLDLEELIDITVPDNLLDLIVIALAAGVTLSDTSEEAFREKLSLVGDKLREILEDVDSWLDLEGRAIRFMLPAKLGVDLAAALIDAIAQAFLDKFPGLSEKLGASVSIDPATGQAVHISPMERLGARMVEAIEQGFIKELDTAREWIAGIPQKLNEGCDVVWDKIKEVGEKILGGIWDGIRFGVENSNLGWLIGLILGRIGAAGEEGSPYRAFIPAGQGMVAGIIQGINMAADAFDADEVMDVFAMALDPGGDVGGTGPSIGPQILEHMDDMLDKIREAEEKARQIKEAAERAARDMADAVENAASGAQQAAQNSSTTIQESFEDVYINVNHAWVHTMPAIINMIETFLWDAINLSRSIGEGLLKDAQNWSGAVSSMAGAISTAIDAIEKLMAFRGIGPGVRGAWTQIREFFTQVFNTFAYGVPGEEGPWGAAPDLKVSERVSGFASAIGSIASMMSAAVDTATKMRDLRPIANFAEKVTMLVGYVKEMLDGFAVISGDAFSTLAVFAEKIGGALGIVASSVEAVESLRGFRAVGNIGEKVAALMRQIVIVLNAVLDNVGDATEAQTEEDTKRLELWGNRMAPAINIITGALAVLRDLQKIPKGVDANAVGTLMDNIRDIFWAINSKLKWITLDFEDGLDDTVRVKLERWSARLGPALEIIKNSLDMLRDLKKIPGTVDPENVITLMGNIRDIFWAINSKLKWIYLDSEDGLDDTVRVKFERWAARLGPALSIIKDSVDMIEALIKDVVAPSHGELVARVMAITDTMRTIVSLFEAWLPSITLTLDESGEQMDSAAVKFQAWADRLGPLLSIINDSLEIIAALSKEVKSPAIGELLVNIYEITSLTQTIVGAFDLWLPEISLTLDSSDEMVDEVTIKFQAWADRLRPLLSIITDTLAIFAALGQKFDTEVKGDLEGLVNAIEQMVLDVDRWLEDIAFLDDGTDELGQKLTAWSDRVTVVANLLSKGMQVLSEMKAWKAISDVSDKFDAFKKAWGYIIEEFIKMAKDTRYFIDEDVAKFAKMMGEIADGLKKAVDLLKGLDGYIGPGQALVDFQTDYQAMFGGFSDWAKEAAPKVDPEIVGPFVELVQKVFDALGSAVNVLTGIRDWVEVGEVAIHAFERDYQLLFDGFATWAQKYADSVDDTGNLIENSTLDVTSRVAEAAKLVFDALGSAVEILTQLRDYHEVGAGLIGVFEADYQRLFEGFEDWAKKFKAKIEGGWVVDKVADAFSAVMAGLSDAIGVLSQLPNYRAVGDTLIGVFEADYQELFDGFEDWAKKFKEDVEDGWVVGDVAEAFSAVMSGLSDAMDVLVGILTYISPLDTTITSFMEDVLDIFTRFEEWASGPEGPTPKQLEIVTAVGDCFGSLFGGLNEAVQMLGGLGEIFLPYKHKIDVFIEQVKDVFVQMSEFAVGISKAQIDATGAFAEVMSALAGSLTDALSFLERIEDATLPEFEGDAPALWFQKKLSHFMHTVDYVIDKLSRWVTEELDPLQSAAVLNFSGVIERMVGGLSTALDFLLKLSTAKLPAKEQLEQYLDAILKLFDAFGIGVGSKPEDVEDAGEGVADALETARVGLSAGYGLWYDTGTYYVAYLCNGITSVLGRVKDAVAAVRAYFDGWQSVSPFYGLYSYAYAMGFNWCKHVADGIAAGKTLIESSLEAVRALFPASPAKEGPFSRLPNSNWIDGYFSDVLTRFGSGIDALNEMGFAGGPLDAGSIHVQPPVYVNITGEWQVRSDSDIELIAERLATNIRREVGLLI